MNGQASFTLRGRNPDVLTCISNLSNDEVFTPPELANRMLDTVAEAWAASHNGANLWADKTIRFLDPCTKSGVFLREITSRLTKGLADEMPNLNERVNHILTRQVFGIGITNLTSLLARRSVYCSKHANGQHSIAKSFTSDAGNIWFERLKHTWASGKCTFCGASQTALDRGAVLETHAYAFIHTDNIKTRMAELFGGNMQFDVIVGNPPYQLDDDGFGTSAAPIYNKFVEQAKKLEPRLLSMVIPARWFSGGKGLDDFRASMLKDERLRIIEDFPDSNDVFPGTQIKGGICYFLWDRDNRGNVRVTTHDKGEKNTPVERPLLEAGTDVFIRYNEALPILKKVIKVEVGSDKSLALPEDKQFKTLVSSRKPFGFDTTFKGRAASKNAVLIYQNGGTSYVARSEITKNADVIDKWKVFIPPLGSGSDAFPHPILGKPFVGEPGSVSSETYLFIGPFKNEADAKNALTYISSQLFRLLVLLHKPSQHATQIVYTFVPIQDFSQSWTDEKLRKKYGITHEEWAFVEKMIRPMDLSSKGDD
ncbi:Eco57I restriction-modification methylase domain-containing protein [Nitrosomonas ureae]|uniref:site-specific DNA-methyltransferase (adenine-specific) n=1 Tax=Nitrosomonas ureae TaxID=44577 RepID=A0A1H2DUX8_9PROT|nr:Eco57I restriction-modification methylase domain-containing protein [Nitrosomonas ureae]ALQ50556.1 restriction endonuclease [Nitrosomonas ureae]SDT86633.1 site-specific DNA-methyltransferase (adenine-specific) [Nitrosomonas ureae]